MRESPIASYLRRRHLPLQATPVRLLGVETMLLPTGDGGDLYVTWDGLHRLDYLLLENWLEPHGFRRSVSVCRAQAPFTGCRLSR